MYLLKIEMLNYKHLFPHLFYIHFSTFLSDRSNYARLYLRHYNELDHEFDAR